MAKRAVVRGFGGLRWADCKNFERSSPIEGEFLLEDLVVGIFVCLLMNCGRGVVGPYPAADGIFRAAVEGVGEGSVMAYGSGNGEGVLGTHEVISSLLALSGEVAVCKLVALEALMRSIMRAIKVREGEAWKAADMYFIRGEACSSTDGVVIGEFYEGEVNIPVVLAFVAHHG